MFLPKVTQVLLVLLVVVVKSSLITRRAIKTRRAYPVFLCVFVLCQCCFIFILCLLCLSFIDLFFRGIKRLPAHTGDLCKCRKWQIFILELGSKMVAKHDISRRWLDRCILIWSRMSLIFSLPTSSNIFTSDRIIFSRRHATTLGAWYWTNECMMTHNNWLLRWWSWMVIVVRYIYKARWIYAISSKKRQERIPWALSGTTVLMTGEDTRETLRASLMARWSSYSVDTIRDKEKYKDMKERLRISQGICIQYTRQQSQHTRRWPRFTPICSRSSSVTSNN